MKDMNQSKMNAVDQIHFDSLCKKIDKMRTKQQRKNAVHDLCLVPKEMLSTKVFIAITKKYINDLYEKG